MTAELLEGGPGDVQWHTQGLQPCKEHAALQTRPPDIYFSSCCFFFVVVFIAEENPEIDPRLFVPDSPRLRCHPLGWDIPAPMGKKSRALGEGSSEGSGADPSLLLRSPRAFSRHLAASWEL